jgi:hypothetical protein
MMTKLTLSCPAAVAEQVVEHFLESQWVEGFTSLAGGGHGSDFAAASLREKVRGHIAVTLLIAVLPQAHVEPLTEELHERFRGAKIRYWTEAVETFGELA